MTLSNRQRYLVRELWILAWNASVQRSHIYNDSVKHGRRDPRIGAFKAAVVDFITDRLLPRYLEECNSEEHEKQHYDNIAELITFANQNDLSSILGKSGYRYGIAQKLLTLILKYLWCAGIIAEPPHCPVDRIIIGQTKYRGKVNWTQISKESQYRDTIEAIKELSQAKNMSLSEWELNNYTRRD
jgi:hypothetical protein